MLPGVTPLSRNCKSGQRNECVCVFHLHHQNVHSSCCCFSQRLFIRFPGNLREQIVARKQAEMQSKKGNSGKPNFLKSFIEGKENYDPNDTSSKPVAELFLESTIIFADIVGFTAWSSVREPAQVFTLLETIFAKFDKLAKVSFWLCLFLAVLLASPPSTFSPLKIMTETTCVQG